MIKNIVFDVGNVLFAYNPHYIAESVLPDSNHKQTYLKHLLLDDFWHDMDRGDYSWEDAVNRVIPHHGEPELASRDVYRLVHEFHFHLTKLDTYDHIFSKILSKYPTYILSNFQDIPFQSLENQYHHLNNVHGKVVSARVNLKKPEPEIYRYLLDSYNLNPEQTIFIDDLPENIRVAETFGIKGILFKSSQQLKHQLNHLGVTFA